MPRPENPIQLAVIGAAHGTRGEVRVKTFTGDPLAITEYGLLYDEQGKSYEVLEVRPAKTVVVVRFKGINDRNAAEALNGVELFIDRSQLPDDELDEDEFFQTDLIGLLAVDAEGKTYGVVSALFDFGGGDLIELSEKGKRPMLIPFTEAAVPEIDLDKGTLLVEPYAAGLIADDEDQRSQNEKKKPKKS
ncbi:ribosome maturation factor RimM [Brucella tritici]|jgi:16S rRNA processing protein RimM|uniref:Ribosome maturation factor RimM n=1 Tax=Brucella tritici TaxID=94626 RepID=A0A6L3YX97_9HYPH|nr:ribosome maturation factor RimM [Brucella tritici]KAB2664771.1 ribosome maturation factor RimM [Brucella tritici]KAB2677392.1 ribosome maturation factor RimM [Brucella tritici]KAB2689991.1 ribosome maturation factor RimM [Brucella tritici]